MGGKWEVTSERAGCSSAWCAFLLSVHTVRSHRGSLWWVQSSGQTLQSSLSCHCAQPAFSHPSLCLSELRGITSDSGRQKQVTECFSLLNSPVVPLCSGKDMKGWKVTRGKIRTFSCWVATHFIQNYCQMLFLSSASHLQSHCFYERFSFHWLKKHRRQVFLLPCRASRSFPVLLRPW